MVLFNKVKTQEQMIEYLVDCTLATVEGMLDKKSTPIRGEFERQCNIAQKGIDWLGRDSYPFRGRAKAFARKYTAYVYYTKRRIELS